MATEFIETESKIVEVVPFKHTKVAVFTENGEIHFYQIINTAIRFINKVKTFDKNIKKVKKITAADINQNGKIISMSGVQIDDHGYYRNVVNIFRIKADCSIIFKSDFNTPKRTSIFFLIFFRF